DLQLCLPFLCIFMDAWRVQSYSALFNNNPIGAIGSRRFRTDFLQELPTPGTGPHFDTSVPNNLTGLVGKTAYLNCRVKEFGQQNVKFKRGPKLVSAPER
ncbi:hypothetical protein L9F63_020355, partial [Diploptera punctata]